MLGYGLTDLDRLLEEKYTMSGKQTIQVTSVVVHTYVGCVLIESFSLISTDPDPLFEEKYKMF